jgi:proteasome beta subunit
VFARGSLKKLYRDDLSDGDCVVAVVQALYDAADDVSATGGPDLTRRIYPVVTSVTLDVFRRWADDDVEQRVQQVVDERMTQPGGPQAPLRGSDR